MKRLVTVLILAGMLVGLFSGCSTVKKTDRTESSQTTGDPGSESPTADLSALDDSEARQTDGPSLTWRQAFRSNALPEGVLTPENIAFYQTDGETVSIVNVPREEVFSYRPERLPRTHYYEQFMSDPVREELLPILDYALAHGYCRCSIPSTTLNRGVLFEDAYYLRQTYRINEGGVGALDVRTFDLEDGGTLTYLLATLPGMDGRGMMRQYLEGIAAAEALVDSLPADSDEMQKALYLYQYLTVNVRYDYGNYYGGSTNLLYDALIKHYTVCAGYTEAFYFLCNLAGIECITLDGYISDIGNGAEVGDSHVWNAAMINGTWYQFDSTWDEGLCVADYAYFGVSDAYMLENHTELIAEKCKVYAPECPGSLFPDQDPSMREEQSGYKILWYCRMQNVRDRDPLQTFAYYGEDRPAVVSEEADGWCVTDAAYDSLMDMLDYLMTPEEAARFCEGHFEDRDGSLAFRLPGDPEPAFRLCGLTPEVDGAWLAEGFLLLPDGSWAPTRAHFTGIEEDGFFRVTSVRRDHTESPAEPDGPSLTWRQAFRSNALPEGVLTPENIAFYQTDGETVSIVNVPREEVFSYRPERLPRTHYYEQFMSDPVREELLPILDYALAHGYCRCSIPTTALSRGLLYQDNYFLRQTYRINEGGVGALDVRTFDLEDGGTLTYLLATLPGMDGRGMMRQYLEGIAAAEALVDSLPADSDEAQKAVFLYQYLTKNVRYDYGNYYGGSTNLLYDALIKHYTVCAGYTEAFYFLCNLAGIECITVDGYDYTPGIGALSGAGDLHIWNAAMINGTWYQFDSTQDGGSRVAKYKYFGVSDAYMLDKHSNVVAEKSEEYGPECPENLFLEQEEFPPERQPEYQIFWYCQFLSARDFDPLQIFEDFRPVRPSVVAQDPEDGWSVTATDEASLRSILETVMTPEEADRFCEGSFEERDGSLAFRVPERDAPLFRLRRLSQEADDLWLVEGYLIRPDGASEPVRAHVTVVETDGSFRVSSVRRDG